MTKHIHCRSCRFARQDILASEYTNKDCGDCESDNGCTCHKRVCKCGGGCKFKGTDEICPMQPRKWMAIECGNPDSEFYKALLNVNIDGDRQYSITWKGCECGVKKDDSLEIY